MDSFNNGSTSVANASFHGGNNENEENPEMASKFRKQLPTKNFMSPTISAANKAAAPKKKILAERNETLDFDEQTSLPSKKGLKFHHDNDDVEKDLDAKLSLQPYDPIKNYLSPRPKYLRYNPNRRRKMFVVQGNKEGGVETTNSSELELVLGSSSFKDSCSQKESVEEAEDKVDEEGGLKDEVKGEGEDEEDEEGREIDEFDEEDGCRWWSSKEFLKFLFVVVAVILTTKSICSMNDPTPSHTLQSMWSFNDWYHNVYGVVHSNFSEVVQDSIRETDLMVGRLKEEVVETIEESVEMQNAQMNDVVSEEVENDETDVILDEMLSNQEDRDKLEWTEFVAETGGLDIDDIVAEIKVHDQPLREDSEIDEKNSQLTTDADSEIAKDMENVVEKEIDDVETNQMISFDLIVAALIGLLILLLTSFGVLYHSKKTKSSNPVTTTVVKENKVAEKEEIMDLEPSPNPSSLIQQIDEDEKPLNSASLQIDVSKEETSHIYAPSVELLGEFEFGEVTSFGSFKSYTTKDYNNILAEADGSNSMIQATMVSFNQLKLLHNETSTGDSHTVKKQVRKNMETSNMVTPSPVRRSSRLQNRRSVKSP